MKIIGIDPGTATTGWGVINYQDSGLPIAEAGDGRQKKSKNGNEGIFSNGQLKLIDFGCILTSPDYPMGERLFIIRKALKKVIQLHQPEHMIIEKLFFGANSTSALSVGQARGVLLLTARESRLSVFEYTGLEVKLAVAGHGRADKKNIQLAVKRHLNVTNLRDPKDQKGDGAFRFRDDAYDAVAVAICHILKSANSQKTTTKA